MRTESPTRQSYDVVIIGGAIMGASTAWFLSDNPDFDGTILVVERDMTFEACSTTHTTVREHVRRRPYRRGHS